MQVDEEAQHESLPVASEGETPNTGTIFLKNELYGDMRHSLLPFESK
jgi:hypothetical protein